MKDAYLTKIGEFLAKVDENYRVEILYICCGLKNYLETYSNLNDEIHIIVN